MIPYVVLRGEPTKGGSTIKPIKVLSIVVAALLLFGACGDDDGNEPAGGDAQKETEKDGGPAGGGAATYTAVDFAFKGPASLPAGKTKLTLKNTGKAPHMMILVELLQGKTIKDVMTYLKEQGAGGPPPKWVRDAGEIRTVKPGQSASASIDLKAGNYVALCFVETKGKPHVAMGMVSPITVQ